MLVSCSPVEHCLDTAAQTLWRVEICLNVFFIFHFIIRVSAKCLRVSHTGGVLRVSHTGGVFLHNN